MRDKGLIEFAGEEKFIMIDGLVSIIMPSWNTARFIGESIQSVLAQTYTNWELLIVDDCSTDNTDEIVQPFLSDDRIKYFKNEKNCGAALTRNRAMRVPNSILGEAVGKMAWDYGTRALNYINPSNKVNLLIIPLYSANGGLFNAWSATGGRYAHTNRIAKMETVRAKRPMGGAYDTGKQDNTQYIYQMVPFYWADLVTNKVYWPKWPSQWEVVDPVAGTGYGRSTMVALNANEVLLNRAEAYIQLKEYDKAAADMDTWNCSMYKVGTNGLRHLTRELIDEVYGDPSSSLYIKEYTREVPTSRKPIHPHGFTVEEGTQEHMTQCLLYCKRIDSLEEGLRWMDLKRYGITIDRFDDTDYDDATTSGYEATVTLPYNDLRRAFGIRYSKRTL